MADDSPIDSATFKELQDAAGADFVVELVDTFLADAPTMLADLRTSFAAGDADTFRRAAHSLKSNSLTFGATALAALARELEHQGLGYAEAPDAHGVAPLDALVPEYSRVAAALIALREPPHG